MAQNVRISVLTYKLQEKPVLGIISCS